MGASRTGSVAAELEKQDLQAGLLAAAQGLEGLAGLLLMIVVLPVPLAPMSAVFEPVPTRNRHVVEEHAMVRQNAPQVCDLEVSNGRGRAALPRGADAHVVRAPATRRASHSRPAAGWEPEPGHSSPGKLLGEHLRL